MKVVRSNSVFFSVAHHFRSSAVSTTLAASLLGGVMLAGIPLVAQSATPASSARNGVQSETATATLPIVFCWYQGKLLFYIRTDTSDAATAQAQGLNYVPQLANVLTSSPAAYDDIYAFPSNSQYNVVPSAPSPVGPKNTSTAYQPLWQVSTVVWNSGKTVRTLKSEAEIKEAEQQGQVTVTKTNIVINCPIIFVPGAGKLPHVKITIDDDDEGRGERK